MKILKKSINELKENDYNPNVIPDNIYNSLKENIKQFGFLQPVLIDEKNVIIDGAHRVRAAKECGLDKIECVIYSGNGDIKEYRKLLTLSMNNIRGQNNEEEFEQVIKDLAYSMDYEDIEKYTGFDVNLISDIIHKNNSDNFDTDFILPTGDNNFQQMTFILSNRQVEIVKDSIKKAKENKFAVIDNENSNGNALEEICKKYG